MKATRSLLLTLFFVLLALFGSASVFAQTSNFVQTGRIRTVVSETAPADRQAPARLREIGIDTIRGATSRTEHYFVYTPSGSARMSEKWVALPDDGTDWAVMADRHVRLSGDLRNKKLSSARAELLDPASAVLSFPPTIGVYKVVAVPLTIQPTNASTTPLTVTAAAIRDSLFNLPRSSNNFYLEASYQKLSFAGVFHPQVDVVPASLQAAISGNCQQQIMDEFTPVVRQRLLEQGINTTNGSVDLGIIIFNDTQGCPPYPFATRGALGARGVPQWLWMPQSWFDTGPKIMSHEIGHMFGGNHSVARRCTNFDDWNTCVGVDAADRDMMTSGGDYQLMPANYERRRWGWHPAGAFAASGPLTTSLDLHSPIDARIKDSPARTRFYYRNLGAPHIGWDVYPEARRNWGLFEVYPLADEAYRKGIAVRMGHADYTHPDAINILLDPNDTTHFDDSPLRLGQQVSVGGVTIKCLREQSPWLGTRMSVQ